MKKSWKFIAMFALSACLVGCSESETTTVPKESVETKTKPTTISLETFLKKLDNNQMEITNFGMDATITATTEMDGKEIVMPLNISMDASAEPLRIKQTVQTDLREFGLGKSENVSYLLDGFMYAKHPENGTWLKTEIPYFKEIMEQSLEQSPAEQLKSLQKHAHLFTIKEKEKDYELTFNGTKDAMQELLDDQLLSFIGDNQLPISAKEKMTYENVTYRLLLDKTSLLPLSLDLITDITTTVEGEPFKTKLDMKMIYRDINTLTAITLPEEAKNAKKSSEE